MTDKISFYEISEDLIAPCGMNCVICSRYRAFVHGFRKSQCSGCRPSHKTCTYLFAKCTGINHERQGEPVFCFTCDQYPCREIKRMDKRYRQNYGMSVMENLEIIKEKGTAFFMEEQYQNFHCIHCGELISVHNNKCFTCDEVTSLIEKKRSR